VNAKAPLERDTPIPFVTVTNWVRSATLCGFQIEPIFREAGLDLGTLHPTEATITVDAMRLVMERCVEAAQKQDSHLHFPQVLGETFAFEYLSDIETFITTSPTLRAASPALSWLPSLINPFMSLTLHEHGHQARLLLSFEHEDASPEFTWHFAESVFVTFCKFARLMLGEPLGQGELTFQHERPAGSPEWANALGLPIRYGQSVNAIWFDRHVMDRPLRGALPSLHQAAGQRVALQMSQLLNPLSAGKLHGPDTHSLSAQIEARLTRQPALLGQGIEALAADLGLHPRTLQRRLREEGQQHSGIVNQVRHTLALQWLKHSPESVEDIGERLGFADRRSFSQAFTRWQGVSPSEFRRQGNP
jgi:AraC-like DNA-binding protein